MPVTHPADVIVVGVGLAGLTAAAELTDARRRALLLDQEPQPSLSGQACRLSERAAMRTWIRFCYYSLEGRFQRSPMMLDSQDSLEGLRAPLKSTPKLRALIKKLGS